MVCADGHLWSIAEVHCNAAAKEKEGRLARKESLTEEDKSLNFFEQKMITRIPNWSPK